MIKKSLSVAYVAILLMTVFLISFPASGIAAEGKGCSIIGTWYGYNAPPDNTMLWIINVFGKSDSSGVNNLEAPGNDPTFGGLFPTAVRATTLRGVWERTSGNAFNVALIGFSIDNNGHTVGIAKMSGTATVINDCNMERLELTLDFFGPTEDPYTDDPFYGFEVPVHYGYRMLVDAQ